MLLNDNNALWFAMVISWGSIQFWKDNVGIFVKVESTLGGGSMAL